MPRTSGKNQSIGQRLLKTFSRLTGELQELHEAAQVGRLTAGDRMALSLLSDLIGQSLNGNGSPLLPQSQGEVSNAATTKKK